MNKDSLPMTNLPAQKFGQESSARSSPSERECILVVDDDESVRRLTRTILSSAGYDIHEAASGREAVLLCEQLQIPIHLVLVDIVMPKLSGRQSVSKMVALRPGLKVLLMSGYPSLSDLLDVTLARSEMPRVEYEFIQKPFAPAALLAKVREILDHPRSV